MEKLEWQKINCLQDKIRIMLPKEWERPSNEILEKKFPYRTKPQEVFADLQENRIITCSLLDKPLQESQIYPAITEIQRVVVHIYPESIKEQAKIFTITSGKAGFFSFITGGITEDYCNNIFILSIDEKMMIGNYCLPIGQLQEGRKILMDILNSIEIKRESKENGIFRHNYNGASKKI